MSVNQRFRTIDSAGFSLVEVLVSVVILSIGLLGMVGMQAGALQANREARLQSTAIGLARELADMMRGNKATALTADNPYLLNTQEGDPKSDTCLKVGYSCGTDGTKVANAQVTEWLARARGSLPSPRILVCVDAAPFDANGLPKKWSENCTAGTNVTPVIKIGWTRRSTDSVSTNGTIKLEQTSEADARPSIVIPVGLTS